VLALRAVMVVLLGVYVGDMVVEFMSRGGIVEIGGGRVK
jgi:hypothetical protein